MCRVCKLWCKSSTVVSHSHMLCFLLGGYSFAENDSEACCPKLYKAVDVDIQHDEQTIKKKHSDKLDTS